MRNSGFSDEQSWRFCRGRPHGGAADSRAHNPSHFPGMVGAHGTGLGAHITVSASGLQRLTTAPRKTALLTLVSFRFGTSRFAQHRLRSARKDVSDLHRHHGFVPLIPHIDLRDNDSPIWFAARPARLDNGDDDVQCVPTADRP